MPQIENQGSVACMFWLFEQIDLPAVGVTLDPDEPTIDNTTEAFHDEFGIADVVGKTTDRVTADSGSDVFKRVPQPAVALSDELVDIDLLRYDAESYIRARICGRDYLVDAFFHAQSDLPHHEYVAIIKRVFRHNLRNRTSEILGWAKILRDEGSDNPEMVEKAATNIIEQSRELERISNETRRLERLLDQGGELRYMNLESIVATIVSDEFQSEFDEGQIAVDIPSQVDVLANGKLRMAVEYLIGNAFEHNDPDTVTVDISATVESDDYVHFYVADTGSGLPEIEQEVVCGECNISDLNHSQGLGLWIVRWILEEYHADVSVEADEDEGTRYEIALPH